MMKRKFLCAIAIVVLLLLNSFSVMAEVRTVPTMEEGLQSVLESKEFPEAYKVAMTKKYQMLKEARDSKSSRSVRASTLTLYVPHTVQPDGYSCGPSTTRQTLMRYGLTKSINTIISDMSNPSNSATYCYSQGIFDESKMLWYIHSSLYGASGDPSGTTYHTLWKNGAYTSQQQMMNMMVSVMDSNTPPVLHTGRLQGTVRSVISDTSKWPITIGGGHYLNVSGYNTVNQTLQLTDPDVSNQRDSTYSSGKYYIDASLVYRDCDRFAA